MSSELKPTADRCLLLLLLSFLWGITSEAHASAHRDAPLIATDPMANITDVYAFVDNQGPNSPVFMYNVRPFEEPLLGTRTLQRIYNPLLNDFTNDASPYSPATEVQSAVERMMFIKAVIRNGAGNRHYSLLDLLDPTTFDPVTSQIQQFDNQGNLLGSTPLEDGVNPDDRLESRPSGMPTDDGGVRAYVISTAPAGAPNPEPARIMTVKFDAAGTLAEALRDTGTPASLMPGPFSDFQCGPGELCVGATTAGLLRSYLLNNGNFTSATPLNSADLGENITNISVEKVGDGLLVGYEDFAFTKLPKYLPVDPVTGGPEVIDGVAAEPRDVDIPGFSIIQFDDLDVRAIANTNYAVGTVGTIESGQSGIEDQVYALPLNAAGVPIANATLVSTTQDGSTTPLFSPADTKFRSQGQYNAQRNTMLFTWINRKGINDPNQAIQNEFHVTEPFPPPTDSSGPGNGVLLGGVQSLITTARSDAGILYSNNFGTPGQTLETLGVTSSGPGANATLINDPFPANNPEPNQVLQWQFAGQSQIRTQSLPIGRTFYPVAGAPLVLGQNVPSIELNANFRFAVDQDFIDQNTSLKYVWSINGPAGDIDRTLDIPTDGLVANQWFDLGDYLNAQTSEPPSILLTSEDAAMISDGFQSTHSSSILVSTVDDPTIWIDNLTVTFHAMIDVDLDDDGDVDGNDFLIIQRTDPSLIPAWEAQYGSGVPSLASSRAIPEPNSLLMVTIAILICIGSGIYRRPFSRDLCHEKCCSLVCSHDFVGAQRRGC